MTYVDETWDDAGQDCHRKSEYVKQCQAHESGARIQHIVFVDEHERGERDNADNERRACPRERGGYIEDAHFFQILQLLIPNLSDYVVVTELPAVEFEHFYTRKQLVHHFDARVLEFELRLLQRFDFLGQHIVDRNENDHCEHADERRHAQIPPQHEHAQYDLQRRRPHHI